MEKTITIDGKQTQFKSTGGAALRYKAQFGRDFFADVAKLSILEKLTKIQSNKFKPSDLDGVDFDFFYHIAWVFAKTADHSIKDPLTWLDSFDEFPIIEIIPEIQELISSTLQSKKK